MSLYLIDLQKEDHKIEGDLIPGSNDDAHSL